MDPVKAAIVISVTLVIVVFFNIILYLGARGNRTNRQIDLFKTALGQISNPWEREDNMLDELSQRVQDLKQQDSGAEKSPE